MRIVVALLAWAGCSWIGVSGPRSLAHPGDCTTSPVLPIVDGVLAAAALGLGTTEELWYVRHPGAESRDVDKTAGEVLLATGVVYAIAAATGGFAVDACREARRPA